MEETSSIPCIVNKKQHKSYVMLIFYMDLGEPTLVAEFKSLK